MPTVRAGTIDDLLADARRAGHPVSHRQITDWVSHGLLDSPTRHGVGRGKGTTKGVFSGNQRRLFAVLLLHRAKLTHIAPLTNLPVGLWLYEGDDYVPLRQTKRALDTWIKAADRSVPARSRLATGQIVQLIAAPEASDTHKTRLLRLLDEANSAGRVQDADALQEALEQVFDPQHSGRVLGPPGAPVSPAAIVFGMVRRSQSLVALRSHHVTDQTFEQARSELRESLASYLVDRPHLIAEAEPSVRHLFEAPLEQEFMANACHDLVTVIGHLLDKGKA